MDLTGIFHVIDIVIQILVIVILFTLLQES